jgi:hypothetical protein
MKCVQRLMDALDWIAAGATDVVSLHSATDRAQSAQNTGSWRLMADWRGLWAALSDL